MQSTNASEPNELRARVLQLYFFISSLVFAFPLGQFLQKLYNANNDPPSSFSFWPSVIILVVFYVVVVSKIIKEFYRKPFLEFSNIERFQFFIIHNMILCLVFSYIYNIKDFQELLGILFLYFPFTSIISFVGISEGGEKWF